MNYSGVCECSVDSGCDVVPLANTMRQSRDSWRRDRTRAGGWVKAAFCAPCSGRRRIRRASRHPRASATLSDSGNGIPSATMRCAPDLPSGLPADVLAQPLAGRLAPVPAKNSYAQLQEWTGVTPEIRYGFWPCKARQKWGCSRPRCGFLRVPIFVRCVRISENRERLSTSAHRTGCRTLYRTLVVGLSSMLLAHFEGQNELPIIRSTVFLPGNQVELRVEPNPEPAFGTMVPL